MSFRKTLLAATVLMAPAIAQAQPVNGLYVAGGAGVNWHDNVSGQGTGFDGFEVQTATFGIRTDIGWVGVVSVGWGFGNGLRLELEGNYRSNEVDGFSSQGVSVPGARGTLST